MPRATVNGVGTFYQQLGEGSDIVLIHGLAANRAFWYLPVARALESGFRVTIYDLRGHGMSDTPRSGYTPAGMAADLIELLLHLNIKRAALVGHSYGGAVALSVAERWPEAVKTLVLADVRINTLQASHAMDDSPGMKQLERALLRGAGGWRNDGSLGIRLLEELAKESNVGLRSTAAAGFIPFKGVRLSRRTAGKWLALLRTTTARHDAMRPFHLNGADIRNIKVPTLLIYGERSHCLPTCRALEQLLPSTSTVIVPKCGHFHPVESPRFFVSTLQSSNLLN